MISKQPYVEYLICTAGNFTSTNLAEHLDPVSHDPITDYLQNEHLTAWTLWGLVKGLIVDSPEAFLIVDDSVQDKRYSRFIELVKVQYSGAVHGLVRGIGIVNLVHSAGARQDFSPMEMLRNAVSDKQIQSKHILSDAWYASAENLKLVHCLGLIFFTTLKSSRMVSLRKEAGYVHLDEVTWTTGKRTNGQVERSAFQGAVIQGSRHKRRHWLGDHQ
jgi:hypothetical protein